jgi:hypothetical protein
MHRKYIFFFYPEFKFQSTLPHGSTWKCSALGKQKGSSWSHALVHTQSGTRCYTAEHSTRHFFRLQKQTEAMWNAGIRSTGIPKYMFIHIPLFCYALSTAKNRVILTHVGSRNVSVDIATGTDCTVKELCFDSRQWQENFTLFHSVQIDSGAHPASCPLSTEGFSPVGTGAGVCS